MTRILSSHSPEETYALGRSLGQVLLPGDLVGLVGDLGAGKTQLVRGLAEGLGVPPAEVASPTFAIVYSYQGRITLHHADLYRLATYDELYATGLLDLVSESAAAAVVEWAEKVPGVLPAEHLLIRIEVAGEQGRQLRVEARGARGAALLERWRGSAR